MRVSTHLLTVAVGVSVGTSFLAVAPADFERAPTAIIAATSPASGPDSHSPADGDIRVEAAPGSQPLIVTKVRDGSYEISAGDHGQTGGFYMMVKLSGVAGRSIQLSFVGPPFVNWQGVEPRCVEVKDASLSIPVSDWRDFEKTWDEEDRISASTKFESDVAYVAFRVPCTPEFVATHLANFGESKPLQSIEIGKSKEGRPLFVVVSRSVAGMPADQPSGHALLDQSLQKPCVVVYAREHPDEQDSGWVALGMIDFLNSDQPSAVAAGKCADFIIIPMLDPDGAAAAAHENVMNGFSPGTETPETRCFANWFEQEVNSGRRLDLVLNLHNPPPSAAFNVACPLMARPETALGMAEEAAHAAIRDGLLKQGFLVRNTPWARGESPLRLAGWLSAHFGAAVLPYEVNSMAPKKRLDLAGLSLLGQGMIESSSAFVASPAAQSLREESDATRRQRAACLARLKMDFKNRSALLIESICHQQLEREMATTAPATAPATP